MTIALRVENLSKAFRIATGPQGGQLLGERLKSSVKSWWDTLRGRRLQRQEFWALKNVSFEVQAGDAVGIVGRNGAGKSTLLKILSRVVEPTSGSADYFGRMGSLLEVGTGFHAELSGRENIFLNGSILGMCRREIQKKFDEIVEFAEIGPFLDTPVKRYSSGMYVKLAFAVAAHLDPDILVLDEVLAVGDAKFQKKCLGKMKNVAAQGRTVLFVSHDMAAVRRLCNRGVMLSKGQVVKTGTADEIVELYLATEGDVARPNTWLAISQVPRSGGNRQAQFTELRFSSGQEAGIISGGPLHVHLRIHAEDNLVVDRVAVALYDRHGMKLLNADTAPMQQTIPLLQGENEVAMEIESLPLLPGNYIMGLLLSKQPSTHFDYIESACEIEVAPAPDDGIRPTNDGFIRCQYRLHPIHTAPLPESTPRIYTL
ncbi:MAG: ABC transporter ATP-binding protein [Gemmataceae bacterium]|jgi:lipopolysaccharide transport system ATP-binding protein|nr:ABC transporter ATP-binding protein [Gemmataceae bacterium]